ncbi:GAF domain-containing protein [Cognatilysobacter bugurensis]|uniref:FHA domain-containing protein n=1 Tax=Cognatilysobacter bugurensis TaxID=543356 RepID=A0A918SZZ4_9GAMM|nr:GAF domain-containing protein [Lysobacter bugurensis]GHA76045.1 hypothetical protein GCM10007067_11560 [Lysobacter bugurensis]
MQARLIAYPSDAAALPRWLARGERVRIGRSAECDLVLEDSSVSRVHAELVAENAGWRLRDLDSKNGVHVDGMQVRELLLPPSCWLRLGDVHCEFAQFDDAQADALRTRQQDRQARSAILTQQVAAGTRFDTMLDDVLQGVLELSGCSRGFMLLAQDGDYLVKASRGVDDEALVRGEFTGSAGAVERALTERRPIVVNQVGSEAWLARRASVVASGVQSLVCLPLLERDKVLGAVYADRRGRGEPITAVDLELLQAFAETATLWLLAGRALSSLDNAPRWSTLVRSRTPAGEADA